MKTKNLLLTSENCCLRIGNPPPGKAGSGVGGCVATTIMPGWAVNRFPTGACVAIISDGGLYVIPGISHLIWAQHCPGMVNFWQ